MGLKQSLPTDPEIRTAGLNRTSVGLKLGRIVEREDLAIKPQSNQRGIETTEKPPGQAFPGSGPQSNQRGIETRSRRSSVRTASAGLNRTSVGLKQEIDLDILNPPL